MNKQQALCNTRGFTLAEMLLASAILAFVLTGMLSLFINSIMLDESNRNLAVAVGHGQYALEEIKNTNFGSINTTFVSGTCWAPANITSRGLSALSNETICFTVAGSDPLDITANVSWRDRGLRARAVLLRTIITEP